MSKVSCFCWNAVIFNLFLMALSAYNDSPSGFLFFGFGVGFLLAAILSEDYDKQDKGKNRFA